ncbi:sigma-70 family RNA polymerase sigma factor [Marixanthomonas sp. SCSIO 43207]|uniref:RNA polymerase sigma factor n=1 Tax=Marixanthomonas sp. SCSIO 43207 TaxID=2779360 RepID=UPI001CA83254|nr:sigma-70 family RNA polymerase sigma factor [Marixanthomonas sp. SCSIO 43207]UAB81386.1 sigma-70 family RNA polymerase sigma factor [Marixanthomonas sp. SCSIO 43207]
MEVSKPEIINYIQKAKNGKQSAFKFLLDTYWNTVFGFQLKRVKNEYEAEDISIETFAKAFDKIKTFDEKYEFATWLIAISKNIQIDKSRKKNASLYSNTTNTSEEHIQKIADHSPTPEDKLITEQNLAELLRYIKQLKPHYQEVINLRYFQEMSYNAIAKAVNEPLNNVKVRLLRAKKLLAEIITENT